MSGRLTYYLLFSWRLPDIKIFFLLLSFSRDLAHSTDDPLDSLIVYGFLE